MVILWIPFIDFRAHRRTAQVPGIPSLWRYTHTNVKKLTSKKKVWIEESIVLAPTKLRPAPSCWDYFRGKAYYWLFGTQHTRYFSELIVRAFNWSKVLLFTFPNDLNEPLAWPFRYKDNQPIAKASFDQPFRIAALLWGAGMALWWFHSPLTHVARVQATTGLSWLFVLYSSPRSFSPGSPVFPSPQKSTFPNSNSLGCKTSLKTTFPGLSGASWVNINSY